MLETVEKRFNVLRAPAPVEWLSDNGSPYTAKETRDFATPAQSGLLLHACRQSRIQRPGGSLRANLKRDYARLVPLPDAGTVLGQLGGWFNDYIHPHSGLGMRSPREFIRAQQPAKVSG